MYIHEQEREGKHSTYYIIKVVVVIINVTTIITVLKLNMFD